MDVITDKQCAVDVEKRCLRKWGKHSALFSGDQLTKRMFGDDSK